MHKKFTALAVATLFAFALVPTAEATETVTQGYLAPAGYTITQGGGIVPLGTFGVTQGENVDEAFCIEEDVCTIEVLPGDELPEPIGGFTVSAEGSYDTAIATATDDNFDSAGIWACFINPEGESPNTCNVGNESPGPDGDYWGYGCGSVSANTQGETQLRSTTIFVDNVQVNADTLQTCFSSQGSVTVVYG